KERKVFKYVRSLLRMRAEHRALRVGEVKVLQATDNTLALMRQVGKDCVVVAFNNMDKKISFEIPVAESSRSMWVEASPVVGRWRGRVTSGKIRLSINPREAIVVTETVR